MRIGNDNYRTMKEWDCGGVRVIWRPWKGLDTRNKVWAI